MEYTIIEKKCTDVRANWVKNVILPEMIKTLSTMNSQEKISTGSVTKKAKTTTLIGDITTLFNNYYNAFEFSSPRIITDVQYTNYKTQYTDIKAKIAALDIDTEIANVSEMSEYKSLVEQRRFLKDIIDQIESQIITPPV